MRISEYDRIMSPSEGDLFVIETLEGTKTIAYEDMGFVSKSSTETISGIKTFSGTVNLDNPLAIQSGGTGASTAALARTALGIGAAGTLGTPIPINRGGTGATTAALVRNGLGLGNTTGALPIANGGTAGTTAALARTNLGIGAAGTLGTPIPVNRGGTAGTTAALARTNLGIGAAGTLGTPIPVNRGGTGGSTVAAALTNLGIGSPIHNYGNTHTNTYSKTISESGSRAYIMVGNMLMIMTFYKASSGGGSCMLTMGYRSVAIYGGTTSYNQLASKITKSSSGSTNTYVVYDVSTDSTAYAQISFNHSTGAFTVKRYSSSALCADNIQLIVFS